MYRKNWSLEDIDMLEIEKGSGVSSRAFLSQKYSLFLFLFLLDYLRYQETDTETS